MQEVWKLNITEVTYSMNPEIGDEKMNGLVDRYMDEETIRIICFFLKIKFDPNGQCCKACARYKLCERDAKKMIGACGCIPWLLGDDLKTLMEKRFGHQRCEDCDI